MPLMGRVMRLFGRQTNGQRDAVRGARVQLFTWVTAILVTWFVMGLWHGAGWLFAIWGLYHALLLIAYRLVPPLGNLPKRFPAFAWVLMLCLAMAGWIPFRARSLSQMTVMFGKIINPFQYTMSNRVLDIYQYAAVLVLILGMIGIHHLQTRPLRYPVIRQLEAPLVGCAVAVMVVFIIMMMHQVTQFVYFQF